MSSLPPSSSSPPGRPSLASLSSPRFPNLTVTSTSTSAPTSTRPPSSTLSSSLPQLDVNNDYHLSPSPSLSPSSPLHHHRFHHRRSPLWRLRTTSVQKRIFFSLVLVLPFVVLAILLTSSGGAGVRKKQQQVAGTAVEVGANSALVQVRLGKAAGTQSQVVVHGGKGGGGKGATRENAFVPLAREGRWSGKETRYLRGIPGYSMFENLYTLNGRFIAITSNASQLPPLTEFLSDMSRGTPHDRFPVADENRWIVITPERAVRALSGRRAARLAGATFFLNDGPGSEGYLAHYFHFVAEIFAGAWRVLAGSPSLLEAGSATGIEFPRRTILAKGQDWRDGPGLNAWFMATVFPNMNVEDSLSWNDRAESNNLYLFDEIVIVDRWASHRHNPTAQSWNKMNGDVFRDVAAPPDWWVPVRENMMAMVGIDEIHEKPKATVLYVSRQSTSQRRLLNESHEALVAALSSLDSIDFHVALMERLTKKEQMELVSKTDVLIGVHGNGLTNEIWMKPGGAVLEIFDIGGFNRDYQILTEPLHHIYLPIWNDTVYDWAADAPGFKLSDHFAGTNLVVSANLVRDLVVDLVKEGGKVDRNRNTWMVVNSSRV